MNNCIENPLTPCAMTGALAVLTGFSDLDVILHGASGCFYYTKQTLKKRFYCSFLLESEIVMGTVDRLRSVIAELGDTGKPIAIVNTCVPGLTGEDLSAALDGVNGFVVDSPGFIGNAEVGVKKAYETLNIQVTERDGVNIDGICDKLDLFSQGNLHEMQRMLSLLGIPVGLKLSSDSYNNLLKGAAPYSVSANPSWNSGIGENLGSFLFSDLKKTMDNLASRFPDADFATLYKEIEAADEKMFYYADKYLRKYTPPTVAVLSQKSYCDYAAWMLKRYLGCNIPLILSREDENDYSEIKRKLSEVKPELILGSSYESFACKDAAFLGVTYPDRTKVSFAAHPLTGIEGAMHFMENVLNTSIDYKNSRII